MKREVISIQKRENTNKGIFGDLERKRCLVTFLENNAKKTKTCYLDTKEILDYIAEYRKYLNNILNETKRESFKGTWKKRLKYNLIASPVYIISLIILFASLTSSPVFELLLQIFGWVLGTTGCVLINSKSLYISPEFVSKIKDLENLLKECEILKEEALDAIENKENDDLKRVEIVHDAMRRKNEMRNKARDLELKNFRNRVERKLHDEKMKEYRGGRPEPDIPDYLKKKR